jgi:hypothetical protein
MNPRKMVLGMLTLVGLLFLKSSHTSLELLFMAQNQHQGAGASL